MAYVRTFSIKAQNKLITWSSTCKNFYNSATVPSYLYNGIVATCLNFLFLFLSLCQPLLLPFLYFFFFDSLCYFTSHSHAHVSLSFKLATGVGLDSEWSWHGGVGVVPVWRRSKWARRGGDRSGVGMTDSDGLFDFLLLIFVFWVWMGWILDSYGLVFWILMGFRLDLDWLVGLAWWVVGCLVVFVMGLLGFWWVLFCFIGHFGFLVLVGMVGRG